MSREEDLCRRLCGYLGIGISTSEDGCLKFVPFVPPGEFALCIMHASWHEALFGCFDSYGLNNLRKWIIPDEQWHKLKSKSFEFSSPEELELQLAARGF